MRRGIVITILLLLAGCIGSLNHSPISPGFVSYPKKIAEVVRHGAEAGDAGAEAALGYFYERGEEGVRESEGEAARLYRLAADQGNPVGLTNLAVFTATGRSGRPDDTEAARLLALAARQGFEPAQNYLAAFYLSGRGNIADGDAAALDALRAIADRYMQAKYCENGHIVFGAAHLYASGTRGVPRDRTLAIRLLEKLARSNSGGCSSERARHDAEKMSAE